MTVILRLRCVKRSEPKNLGLPDSRQAEGHTFLTPVLDSSPSARNDLLPVLKDGVSFAGMRIQNNLFLCGRYLVPHTTWYWCW